MLPSNSELPATSVPPVLFASPSVVMEVRDQAAAPTLLVNNDSARTSSVQDLALASLGVAASDSSDLRLASMSKLKAAAGPLDEQSWEDLLSDLASDQEENV